MAKPKRDTASRGEFRSFSVVMADGPDFRKLSPEGRFTVFIARLSLGASGIDAMPGFLYQLADRTGYDIDTQRAAWTEAQDHGWCYYDGSVAWLVRALEFETGRDISNMFHRTGVQRHTASLPRTALVGSFVERYRQWWTDPTGAALPLPTFPAPDPVLAEWLSRHGIVGLSNGTTGAVEGASNVPPQPPEVRITDDGERNTEHGTELPSSRAREALLEEVRTDLTAREFLPTFERALRDTGDVDELLREIATLRNGMHGPSGRAVSLTAIGMALADMKLKKVALSIEALRRFAATAVRQLARRPEDETPPATLTPVPRL